MAKQPREYLRWDLLDRAEDPVPWLTSDVRGLRKFYEKLSEAAEQAAADMRRLEGDRLGRGDTVAALKELVNELPKHLDKAQTAYEKGYKALDKWETSLGTARMDSASIARQAATAYAALEDTDAWEEKTDGDDPVRKAHIDKLTRVLNEMDEAAGECASALEEAKQGSPRKLWGWLDKIVTWVEENPLLYAVAMVVAGLAAIFIPGLGIALALTVLAISAATLHKEGKLGFNRESLFTLGMDALSLVPGGALLRGGRAVGKVAGQAATRMPGRMRSGVSRAADSVRNSRVGQATKTVSETAGRARGAVSRNTAAEVGYNITKDSAASMASSITVQVAGEGKSFSEISLANEALTAVGTSAAGSTAGVLKDNGTLPDFFGGGSGDPGGGSTDPAPDPGGFDPDLPGPVPDGPAPDGPSPAPDGPGPAPDGPSPAPDGPGPAPDAPAPDAPSPAPDGPSPAPDGPAPDGPNPAPDGPAPDGPAPDGPAPDGPAPDAPAPDGPAPDAPAPDAPSPAPDGPSPAPDGPSPAPEGNPDGPNTRDAELREGNLSTREEPREDFAPLARPGGGMNAPQLPNRPQNQIGDPDILGAPIGGRDDPRTPEPPDPQQRGDGSEGADPQRRDNDPETSATQSGEGRQGDSRQDGPPAAPSSHGGRGEFTTTRGPDGDRSVSYRYPGARQDGSEFTMDVTPDRVAADGWTVNRDGSGFGTASPDGSSAAVSRGERGQPGTVDLTDPGGRPGVSYRDGQITVPTRQGEATVTRGDDGPTISTSDGLNVTRPANGDDTRITLDRGSSVDLRFEGGGPAISRVGDGVESSVRVSDPGSGRTTDVNSFRYSVDTENGTTHGYERGTDTVTVDSGTTRAEASTGSVRVSDGSRGVDLRQSRDGDGVANAAGARSGVRSDGSFEIRLDGGAAAGRASRSAEGDIAVGDTRVTFDEPGSPNGVVRTGDGATVRETRLDGKPALQVTRADGVKLIFEGNPPSTVVGGNRITLNPDGPVGTGPSLRVDTSDGWTVNASGPHESGIRTPPDSRGDSLELTRRADGTNEMAAGDHRVSATPGGEGAGRSSQVRAEGPDGVVAGSSDRGGAVSDGTTRTETKSGDPAGLGSARTSSEADPSRTYVDHTGGRGNVRTEEGATVRSGGDGVRVDVPHGADRSVRNGDRTIEVGRDRTSVTGGNPDHRQPRLRMGEHAGEGAPTKSSWRLSSEGGSTSGRTRPGHEITVDSSGDSRGGRLPFRGSEDVRFSSGDVHGTQTGSGRTTMTDADGTTVRDARGGVRVDSGNGGPNLRITNDHVRVNGPDGTQQRVDFGRLRDGADGAPARGQDEGTATPDRDGTTDRTDGEGSDSGNGNGNGDGNGSPARPERDPVTTLRDTRRAAIQAIPFEVFKNILNVVAGTGFDFARYYGAEALGQDWLSERMAFGPDGLPNPSYVVQSFMQLGTAVPKAAAEGRYGGADGLPNLPLELGHQAMRNNLRDEYLDEFHEDFREGEEVQTKVELLNKLLDGKNLDAYEASRNDDLSDPRAVEEQQRADRFLAEAMEEREALERRLAELYDVSLEDVEKMRKQD